MLKPASPSQMASNRQEGEFLPNLCHPTSVLLLVVVAELIALLLSLNASRLPRFSWDLLALYSFQIQWISLASAFAVCRIRPWLQRHPPMQAGLTAYGLVLLITLVMSLLGQLLLQVFTRPVLYGTYPITLNGWSLLHNMIASAILSGITLRYLYLQQQLRNQKEAELNARIQALQSRIRPHFLFNSMNSIASLIGSDPEKAERVVEDLAELFRASLAEPTLTNIAREITLCKRYLDIEQLRMGKRLNIEWQIDEQVLSESVAPIRIPSLMLQPLVENSIFHGIEPLPQGGTVRIKISISKNMLSIVISNPYPLIRKNLPQQKAEADTSHEQRHNRMALDNIRHRLRVHYGDRARLSSSAEQGIFTTYIFCPLQG